MNALALGRFLLIAAVTTSPVSAQNGQPSSLSVYEGKYPADSSLPVSFLEHPLVVQAVEQTVPHTDIRRWLLNPAGPKTPIWIKQGRIHSWGCEAHNCGPHNWTISMKLDGSDPVICYYSQDIARNSTQWFLPGRTEWRLYPCPGEARDASD